MHFARLTFCQRAFCTIAACILQRAFCAIVQIASCKLHGCHSPPTRRYHCGRHWPLTPCRAGPWCHRAASPTEVLLLETASFHRLLTDQSSCIACGVCVQRAIVCDERHANCTSRVPWTPLDTPKTPCVSQCATDRREFAVGRQLGSNSIGAGRQLGGYQMASRSWRPGPWCSTVWPVVHWSAAHGTTRLTANGQWPSAAVTPQ